MMNDNVATGTEFGEAQDMRSRIITVAATLIAAGGRDAATTRAIAAAAGVQAPTIYRLFGDKRGLLDAVAQDALEKYVSDKASRQPHPDPLQELRDGWDRHIAFGLEHPELFAIMVGDPRPHKLSRAAAAGVEVLLRRIRQIALAGRLHVSEARAIGLVESMALGTIITLLAQPIDQRDIGLSISAREAVIAAITNEKPVGELRGANAAATALRASLDDVAILTYGERHLMKELLNRISDAVDQSSASEDLL